MIISFKTEGTVFLYKLNSLLTYYQQGFIAQLVEHCTSIVEVMSLNPVEASDFFLDFLCNCFSCFITVTITFTSIKLCLHKSLGIYTCKLKPVLF